MSLSKEQLAVAGLGIIYCEENKPKRRRRCWVKGWLEKRCRLSHINLMRELRQEPDDWRNYMRMNETLYVQLLDLVAPIIRKNDTTMRDAITPHERLSATLRFLATGRRFEDLKFSVVISPQSLSKIIPEVCSAILTVLKDYIQFPKVEEEWEKIAKDFEENWNFPNCLGAVDGKHIQIIPPAGGGSFYFNYKHTHSIVLMAIANANYEFIMVDCGTNGRVSDGGALEKTKFYKKFTENNLKIPAPRAPSNTNVELPYVFVGDEAFSLHVNFMKPFAQRNLSPQRRIFNYRLSRSRRIVENTFGILANRFQVLQTAINLRIDRIPLVVMACCALHNYLRRESSPSTYIGPQCVDNENVISGTLTPGLRTNPEIMHCLQRGQRRGNASETSKSARVKFMDYFNTDGQVEWQNRMIAD